MENEKIILKADIRRTPKNILIIIWYILGAVVSGIGTFGLTINYENVYCIHKEYYLFFFPIYRYYDSENHHRDEYIIWGILLGLLCILAIIVLPLIMRKIADYMAKECSLSLTDKSITGCKKNLFSSKALKLPIEKIDAIMASHNIFDSMRGGETLLIRSASGVVKFPWVQNADEFVSAALAEIEKFKKSVNNENKNLIASALQNAGNSSSAQKIKEIKDLLDNGLISQEEFEAKRKELLNNM
ncbi:MAG: SHOCT domain-containing protein [Ruminococcus sp.]